MNDGDCTLFPMYRPPYSPLLYHVCIRMYLMCIWAPLRNAQFVLDTLWYNSVDMYHMFSVSILGDSVSAHWCICTNNVSQCIINVSTSCRGGHDTLTIHYIIRTRYIYMIRTWYNTWYTNDTQMIHRWYIYMIRTWYNIWYTDDTHMIHRWYTTWYVLENYMIRTRYTTWYIPDTFNDTYVLDRLNDGLDKACPQACGARQRLSVS